MNTHNICFHGEIRKYQYYWIEKASYQELCVLMPKSQHDCIATDKRATQKNGLLISPLKHKSISDSHFQKNKSIEDV